VITKLLAKVSHNYHEYSILKALEQFIPQIKKKAKPKEVPWWSKQVKTAVRKNQSAFKKLKPQTFLSITIAIYKVCRNQAKDVMRQAAELQRSAY